MRPGTGSVPLADPSKPGESGVPKAIYLTLACGQYDINQGLITGEVVPHGIELSVITAPSPERHWRMVRDAEFEDCEFSIGTYLMVHERDRSAVVAIPAFPHRRFQHGYIFVATAIGIGRTETARGAPHRHPDLADLGLAVGARLPARRLRASICGRARGSPRTRRTARFRTTTATGSNASSMDAPSRTYWPPATSMP